MRRSAQAFVGVSGRPIIYQLAAAAIAVIVTRSVGRQTTCKRSDDSRVADGCTTKTRLS
ncbi:MAG TPA: hypothetical protein VH816_11125 [Gaiellaceae bacterium]|jgi:hypothetical protein